MARLPRAVEQEAKAPTARAAGGDTKHGSWRVSGADVHVCQVKKKKRSQTLIVVRAKTPREHECNDCLVQVCILHVYIM